jgi:hypothetical protein
VLIIGECINSTRKHIREAVLRRDADYIRTEAMKQLQAGAHILDVNGGVAGQEVELLYWLDGNADCTGTQGTRRLAVHYGFGLNRIIRMQGLCE